MRDITVTFDPGLGPFADPALSEIMTVEVWGLDAHGMPLSETMEIPRYRWETSPRSGGAILVDAGAVTSRESYAEVCAVGPLDLRAPEAPGRIGTPQIEMSGLVRLAGDDDA